MKWHIQTENNFLTLKNGNNISSQPKSDFIPHRFCPSPSKLEQYVQKLKPIPKKLKDFTKKTQGTGGFALFDPPKKREKKAWLILHKK